MNPKVLVTSDLDLNSRLEIGDWVKHIDFICQCDVDFEGIIFNTGKDLSHFEAVNNIDISYFACIEANKLEDCIARDQFLIKLFMLFNYKKDVIGKKMKALVNFHSKNKYLYFAYDISQKDELGSIVANHEKKSLEELSKDYFEVLTNMISKKPSNKKFANAFYHIFGYFSRYIEKAEKARIMRLIDEFGDGKRDRSSVAEVLKDYALNYNMAYLCNQTIFEPYPQDLMKYKATGVHENR